MYIQTDFFLDLALKFCLPHPLNSINFFSHSIYHFLNVSVKETKNPLSTFSHLWTFYNFLCKNVQLLPPPIFIFSDPVLCAKSQLWLPSSGARQASCPSLASISVCSSDQLPPSPSLIILPWIEHCLEYIISLLSVSLGCLLRKTYGEAFFLLEGWPSRQGFGSKLSSMKTRIARLQSELREPDRRKLHEPGQKYFSPLTQTMFAGADD